ncbi:AAA family ATPase [Actinoplanes sp. NBRC 101535]|uniref:helix-turn-helix transcriptional regulator n=1 Tax=Actinoplanes sp. NBRC 101535 TaxID=3032196 RepID=UPI0024A15D69|nr:AAA family ATPase [Actinoplanes sp. NBRC 101535]GLY08468.1 transcriptional regulator [Actinoplanes sp. NBRC 101535]
MAHLIGRESEIAVLTEALGRAAEGRGGAFLLLGEAGVGKSALLAEVAGRARDTGMRVLVCVGVPASAGWAFAGLRQLLDPVLDGVDALLPATREALLTALGEADADGVPIQRVALAVLQLLSDAGQQMPVVVTVDDIHWLDRATSRVLAFVARRLADDAVLLLAAGRLGETDDNPLAEADLPDLPVNPLDRRAAEALVDSRVTGLPPAVRERLLAAAVGNPLALTELATVADRVGDDPAGPALPLTDRLDRVFGAKARRLPEPAASMAAIVALNDADAVSEALAAAGAITGRPVALDDLSAAEHAGLMWVTAGHAGFRHPLMRAAVDRAIPAERRRAIHAALAQSITTDDDRRLWHTALATAEPDEAIAVALEHMARRRAQHGGDSTAAVALEHAARLSPDPVSAARRLAAAVSVYSFTGPGTSIRRVADRIDLDLLGPLEGALVSALVATTAVDRWAGPQNRVLQAELMLRHGRDDPARAMELLSSNALLSWWGNFDDGAREFMVRAVDSLLMADDAPLRLLGEAVSHPFARGDRVRGLLSARSPAELGGLDQMKLGDAAICVGALPAALTHLSKAVTGLRHTGQFAELLSALTPQAWAAVLMARHDMATNAADEALRIAGEVAFPRTAITVMLAAAMVAARRGETRAAGEVAARAEAGLAHAGAFPLLSMVQLVRGTAALADGDPERAFAALLEVCDPGARAYQQNARVWALTDLMDAASLCGRLDEVRSLHASLTDLARRSGSPQLLVATAASAPLLAEPGRAGAAFDAAFAAGIEQWPWQRGSLLLSYGRWLRVQRRKTESREALRSAYALYEVIGAPAWAERAAAELRASGESMGSRSPRAASALSRQELQIASLAAQGMTNREIGERLFVSHRTVRNNLYRIFPRLGVSSRGELAEALGQQGRQWTGSNDVREEHAGGHTFSA